MSEPSSIALKFIQDWFKTKQLLSCDMELGYLFDKAIIESAAPLIAALEAQIQSCEMGDRCKVCNQARKAIQEFHSKYPKQEMK